MAVTLNSPPFFSMFSMRFNDFLFCFILILILIIVVHTPICILCSAATINSCLPRKKTVFIVFALVEIYSFQRPRSSREKGRRTKRKNRPKIWRGRKKGRKNWGASQPIPNKKRKRFVSFFLFFFFSLSISTVCIYMCIYCIYGELLLPGRLKVITCVCSCCWSAGPTATPVDICISHSSS